MATATAGEVRSRGFLATSRRDAWWVAPLFQGLGFLAFAVYTTWAMFQNANYVSGPYLSPFYAPVLWVSPGDTAGLEHAWFGVKPDWLPYPSFLPFSPAVLILWVPLGFRLSCYYYRKFYYRAYFASPPGCAVGSVTGASYRGERRGLFWLWNFHRFFLYLAMAFVFLLAYDAIKAFWWQGGFYLGLGNFVMVANVVLLAGFTFGCNSLRHLAGGGTDCFSCERFGAAKHAAWKGVTFFNRHHMGWAWWSMLSVGLTDVYVRLCASGVFTDPRIL
jgi:hypothetical protein